MFIKAHWKPHLQHIGGLSPSAGVGGFAVHQNTVEALSAADRRVFSICWTAGFVVHENTVEALFAADRRVFSVCWTGGVVVHQNTVEALSAADRHVSPSAGVGGLLFIKTQYKPGIGIKQKYLSKQKNIFRSKK